MKMTPKDQIAAFAIALVMVFLAGAVIVGLIRDKWRERRKRK